MGISFARGKKDPNPRPFPQDRRDWAQFLHCIPLDFPYKQRCLPPDGDRSLSPMSTDEGRMASPGDSQCTNRHYQFLM